MGLRRQRFDVSEAAPSTVGAHRWAIDVLAELGHDVREIHEIRGGNQARVYRLETVAAGHPSAVVLKEYPSVQRDAPTAEARREFDALRAFAERLGGDGPIRCPAPIACADDGSALLMSWMDGVSLGAWLATRDGRRRRSEIAMLLVAGLRTFHDAAGEVPYGDFHSGNVLIAPTGLTLIDPTLDRDFLRQPVPGAEDTPLIRDLGYWTYTTCVEGPRRIGRNPARHVREVRFNRRLVSAAHASTVPAEASRFVASVAAVARSYVDRLTPTPGRIAIAPIRRRILRRSIAP